MEQQLIEWGEEEGAEQVLRFEMEGGGPEFEQDLRRQLEARDFVVTKVEYLTEIEREVNRPEVHVHMKSEAEVGEEEELVDSEFLKRVGREQRRLIAGQRRPVPPEDLNSRRGASTYTVTSEVSPVVRVGPDVLRIGPDVEEGDGIVWTPIPEVEMRRHIPEMEFQEDGYKERRRGEDGEEIIDRKSIIENKDNTKEFLMGKMLESQENDSFHNIQTVSEVREKEFSQQRIQRTEIKINFPGEDPLEPPPPLPKSPAPLLPAVREAPAEEAMQLVSARPAIVVEFPKKVSDSGVTKTRAQQSAEARIAKEIEEIQLREAELMRARITIEPVLETPPMEPAEPDSPIITKSSASFASSSPVAVPDILTHQFPSPPSPLPNHAPSFQVLEKPKVKPLVDSDSDGETEPRYTFCKETAVERDVRLATQREEELKKEKQQIQQQQKTFLEPELVSAKVVELERQVEPVPPPPFVALETSSVKLEAKREPLAKLVLSGPAPSAINYTRVPELKFVPSSPLPVKTTEMEIILRSPVPVTPTTPSSASIISGKPWNLSNNNSNGNGSVNWNGSLSRGAFTNERGTNRQPTKGLMEKFLANHKRPTVFVPKTTVPQVQPIYDSTTKSNGETNHNDVAATSNGHVNGHANGHVEQSKENIVDSEIVKIPNPKNAIKRLSSVENMILEELRNIQKRELELRKERSTTMTEIEENGEEAVNENVNNSGAWGIFILNNDNNNNNSSVC